MSVEMPIPQASVSQTNEVAKAQGYLNYIGEERVYFLLPNLGWRLFYNISDQALKQQILTAFANPDNFEVFIFYQGTTINGVQVKATS